VSKKRAGAQGTIKLGPREKACQATQKKTWGVLAAGRAVGDDDFNKNNLFLNFLNEISLF
jgi:hypothetical protein